MSYYTGQQGYHNIFFAVENPEGSILYTGACYSAITYEDAIKERSKNIWLFQNVNNLSFKEREIRRWLDDLNEMGFPNHFELLDNSYLVVRLDLAEFKGKIHLSSTLMLVRLIWENGSILDKYLMTMDEIPDGDKFSAMQQAHIDGVAVRKGYNTLNTNHIVTTGSGGKIDKEVLFKRFLRGPKTTSPAKIETSIVWSANKLKYYEE